MKIGFGTLNVTLVVTPYDLRCGYAKLSIFARDCLGIDLKRGEDAVVFFSKRREIVKVVMADPQGTLLITRRLHAGRFQKFLMAPEGKARISLTVAELERMLDGEDIQVERSNFFYG